jgi:hypothetical protein
MRNADGILSEVQRGYPPDLIWISPDPGPLFIFLFEPGKRCKSPSRLLDDHLTNPPFFVYRLWIETVFWPNG